MSGQVVRFDDSAHRAADALLPWFVNGTLTGKERAAVEQHVRECGRCRREVEALMQLQAFCAANATAAGDASASDASTSYRRLRERIDRTRRGVRLADWMRDTLAVWRRVPRWVRWGLATQAMAVAVLVTEIALPAQEAPAIYRTLGAAGMRGRPETIAVVFATGSSESEMRRIVQAAGARVVKGPNEAEAYVLEVSPGKLDAALVALRSEPQVLLAQPLAVP